MYWCDMSLENSEKVNLGLSKNMPFAFLEELNFKFLQIKLIEVIQPNEKYKL